MRHSWKYMTKYLIDNLSLQLPGKAAAPSQKCLSFISIKLFHRHFGIPWRPKEDQHSQNMSISHVQSVQGKEKVRACVEPEDCWHAKPPLSSVAPAFLQVSSHWCWNQNLCRNIFIEQPIFEVDRVIQRKSMHIMSKRSSITSY